METLYLLGNGWLPKSWELSALRLLTPPMETPDPPNDTPGALKQVVLTPHDIPWSLRVGKYSMHPVYPKWSKGLFGALRTAKWWTNYLCVFEEGKPFLSFTTKTHKSFPVLVAGQCIHPNIWESNPQNIPTVKHFHISIVFAWKCLGVRRRLRHISLVGVEAFPPQADDPLARALPLAKVQYGSKWEKSVNGAIDTNPKLHALLYLNREIPETLQSRWFKSWPFYPLVGGHLTFERVT